MVQRAAPDHSLTRIDSRCPDLDQNLTGSWNGARHVAHLENVDATIRIELHCFRHEAHSNPEFWSKVTPGNSRRSAARSTAKPTRSNHSYILTASSPMRWRTTSSGTR